MNRLLKYTLVSLSISLSAIADIDFNRDIRPIFNRSCTGCHGGVKKAGGLSLITKEEAFGKTKNGIGIVPGKPQESMLYKLITHDDPSKRMPFEKTPLTKDEIQIIKTWIEDGAQWDEHWAYMPIKNAVPPANPAKTAIDKFINRELSKQKISPTSEANKNTLIRRAFLDLIGMPPSQEEFLRFQQASYEEMLDYLLENPKFGEKWTSMWLDLARYADTMGYEKDPHRSIYPYRSWLIKAFNKNMPYDQFITEQIAGDMLPKPTQDQVIATAFHRNTQTNTEGGTDDEEFRVAAVLDRTVTTWEALMGTSFGCVQCHSHPYDPIDHKEYYQFMSFFNNSADSDKQNEFPTLLIQSIQEKEKTKKEQAILNQLNKEKNQLSSKLKELKKEKDINKAKPTHALTKPKEKKSAPEQKSELQLTEEKLTEVNKKIKTSQGRIKHFSRLKIPIMKELEKPRESHVFIRGSWEDLGEKVSPAVPKIMNPFPKDAPKNRLGLSQWLTSPDNTLVSRVAVNRFWEQIFGYGLVETLEDFGSQGKKPSHPELLDYLAYKFMHTHKWSMKSLIREILLSDAYRRSSEASLDLVERDPRNQYLARFPRVRLTPEQIRDQALQASGLLNEKMLGPSVMPYQPDGVWQSVYNGGKWIESKNGDQYRRALYTYWKRTSPYPAMETFDMTSRENCTTRRIRTNTPLQALVTLNDPAFLEIAGKLGERMNKQEGDFSAKINHGFALLLARKASNDEIIILKEIYDDTVKNKKQALESWTVIANIMLNLDETINKI
ncbi:PSD1 and planctomycete cytochrome C domain-containing protein [Lentisphaera profundi]|uniref:PSD1 and planctomycete cytochrome C domain-containing protein n=1 Tax=Lentisphaera profundi TaxID=1658616 RepID=A0ABY7W0N7_9BACT|nr:PSD1 and planctomycete cytochrome C domain-containing protein [Lentisphaera profundi]WDE99038.1 PSD1 and planctomycete cytochrome C domain-containing protein [Lentisphaera profundi]